MTIGARRAGFYVSVLAIGFVVGGFLSALMDRFLPQGPAKEFFTWTVSPSIGPFHINLLVVNMTLGPLRSRPGSGCARSPAARPPRPRCET